MTLPIPKPARLKKQTKPLKRSPIKPGRKCPECYGKGSIETLPLFSPSGLYSMRTCEQCNGTGRVRSQPIARSSKPIKRNADRAAFDIKVIVAIWPDYRCPLTQIRHQPGIGIFVDPMHILGRGGGDYRFSSPYNHCPGYRGFHAGPYRDTPEMRTLLLRIARRNVDEAIRTRRYEPTPEEEERDAAFLELAQEYSLPTE